MKKRFLVVCVFFLLIVSSIGSLSFGNKLSEKIDSIDNNDLFQPLDEPMDSAWPMQSHDLHHTGLSQYSTAGNPGVEKWRFKTRYGLDGSPVIDGNGTIYFGALDGYIYALYPNGTMKWRYETDNWITSAPAVDEDGTIYVGSWDTNLYAMNPDGTKKWSVGTGGSIASSPAIGGDGTIYLGHMDNNIVAVNPNGTIKWSYPTGYKITGGPAIGDDGTIYCGSGDTYFYALYPNGTLKWRFKTGDYIKAPPSIADDGTIYIGSFDDYLYALYPNGTLKWSCHVSPGTELNPSIASDGTIYTGFYELFAVYPNGTIKWSFNPGPDKFIFKSSPAISADGTIYFGTNIGDSAGGEIIAINSDGTERWRKQIAEWWVDSSPAIAEDGTVYIGSTCAGRGYLHAFGSVESNSPPDAPSISGESNGKVGVEYEFRFQAFDPDNNPVSFYIEWGDGSTTGWTFERASGEIYYYDHTWSEKGNYTIRAKAKDVFNEESNWTEFEIKITNPRNRLLYFYYWIRFLERFPIFQKLINYFT
jgi:outer membrane protein assembly factor BamB